MNFLCISTSESITSVALSWGEHEDQISFDKKKFPTSETLIEKIDELLSLCHIERETIAGIGVNIGPGSFTGTRIGVATANGLGFGLRVPVAGFSSLDLIAEEWVSKNKNHEGKMLTAIDAGRKQFFAAFYEIQNGILKKIGPDALWDRTDFIQSSLKLPLAGWQLETGEIPFEPICPSALSCLHMLKQSAKLSFPSFVVPNYIRATDAENKKISPFGRNDNSNVV